MHILATETATLDEAAAAVDLGQSPADVVVLSFSDSDLSALAEAWHAGESLPALRLASLKQLRHPMSVDLYIDRVIAHARVVVVRCLGGVEYWRYGLERIAATAQARGIAFAALPGDDRPDPRLGELSTVDAETLDRLDRYFRAGGRDNLREALRYLAALQGRDIGWREPVVLGPLFGLRIDGAMIAMADLAGECCQRGPLTAASQRPLALVIFYRALVLAGDTAPILAMMAALEREGMAALAVAVTSLKDPAVADGLGALISANRPRIILNATAFSAMRDSGDTILDAADVPVLQIILAGATQDAWNASPRGLTASDQAMNVVLPELDGRLLTRAISFKEQAQVDPALEHAFVRHAPDAGRVAYVAKLAAAWARLAETARAERRVALVLSDYPAREGRAGYAVGLDTARSVGEILALLRRAGFEAGGEGCDLRASDLRASDPHASDLHASDLHDLSSLLNGRCTCLSIRLEDYRAWLADLPAELQTGIADAWGPPEADPHVDAGAFRIPMLRFGKVVVALQPDRGARADRKSGYHDATLPPRHAYVAFYAWLRQTEHIDALVHLGTHGTLEWLPGKALALSDRCWPEAILGPIPVIYPFIVNNPGEAVQAKRRLAAVTIGHLTPPPGSAGLHGALSQLEQLVEEYASADGIDRRRMAALEQAIIDAAWASGFAGDCGLDRAMTGREAIARLDAQLCDIKELSIRDSLHVFGQAPDEDARQTFVAAIEVASPTPFKLEQRAYLLQALAASGDAERAALIAALDGRRVAPGPAGAPSRGRVDVLPTGRNLTSIDPRAIPTRTAATLGRLAAEEVIRRHLQDHGEHPRALLMTLWASANLRTGGDDIAQALWYLGVEPVWDPGSGRVTGIAVQPLAKLGRPRIDVTLRISGLFRDIFETQIALIDLAVGEVARRDEEDADNPLAQAHRDGRDLARVFGSAPGTYGAAVSATALDASWATREDLGRACLDYVTHGFSGAVAEATPHGGFGARVAASVAVVHGQDDRERDLLDSDEVADFVGGLAAAAALLGADPALYHLDTSRPTSPKARTLAEEVARVTRGRLTNPRWIEGMLSHGHRGVAEIAQSVDALFAFAVTAEVVPSHLFDAVHATLIADEATLERMIACNPAAVRAIANRLADAMSRQVWTARRNAVRHELATVLARCADDRGARLEAAQ